MCTGFSPTGLLSPFHSRRVHPALSGYDKGLRLVVEAVNLDVVDLFRNAFRYVAPSVPAYFAVKPHAGCFFAIAYFVALFNAVLLMLKMAPSSGCTLCVAMFLTILFITRITLVSLGLCL